MAVIQILARGRSRKVRFYSGDHLATCLGGFPAPGARGLVTLLSGFALIGALLLAPCAAMAAGSQAPWVDGYKSKVRLIGGHEIRNGKMQTIAGIEITLPPKWKTYWRNPGDAGGVPPEFDWSKSENVAGVDVLFPAPKRLTDETGDSIGYKDHVVFPVMVEAKDAGQPIVLRLDIFYGVCFDICVPAEAKLELELPAVHANSGSGSEALPQALHAALAKVPAPGGNDTAPMLVDQSFVFEGEQPHAELTADFGGGGAGADLFVEGPAGVHLPMAQRTADAGAGEGVQRYRIDLSRVDKADLSGETITVTLVGGDGLQSETKLNVP